jgi:hypothetical protein
MKFNLIAMALAGGLFWAPQFVLWLQHLFWPSYGRAVLDWAASVYPGYHPGAGVGSVVTGTLYALVDGAVAGLFLGAVQSTADMKLAMQPNHRTERHAR